MASVLETEIENPTYINFLKVGLGLKELQKGLGPFIENQLKTIHGSIISRFGGSYCGKCTSSNILIHTHCRKKGCICRRKPVARRRSCLSKKCVKFYYEMVKQHRFGDPQLINSDVSTWFSDHWEFGKCFMLPHSSDNKTSATQCDASALLTLIINCKPFEKGVGVTIQTPPNTPKDVFSEVRDIRNSIMHSVTLEVSEADMKSYLDKIESALKSGLLQRDAVAKRAATEIRKLKEKAFVVTRPLEKEVLEDKLNALDMLSRNMTDNIDKVVEAIDIVKPKLQDCERKIEQLRQKQERDNKRLTEAGEEMNSKLNANSVEIKTLDFCFKNLQNKDLERLIDDTEADLKTHRDIVEKQNLPDISRLTEELLQTLRSNHILVLTGNSGAGKTYQSLQILSLISQNGDHKPVIIRNYEDFKHVVSYEEPLCILVDDIFGKHSLNVDVLAKWNQYMNTFVSQIKRKKFLLVITLNSVREKQCLDKNAYKTIAQYSTNLDDNGLTQAEKKEIARHCIVGADDGMVNELAAEEQLPLGFPLLCQLAKDKKDINKLKTESLQDIIKNMEPSSFIPLLMTLLTGEQFDVSCLRKRGDTVMAKCLDEIKEHFGSYTCADEIMLMAESMIGSYLLRNESGMLKFIHHAVLEATFKAAIEKNCNDMLIEYCHLGLLLKLTNNLPDPLKEREVNTLLKRINTEDVPAKQLACCPLWTEDPFQDDALNYFRNKFDFFITCDCNGDSPFVAFSGLGLQKLLTKILNRKWKLPSRDLQNQIELALLEACSHGHLECVKVLLNQPDTAVRDEHMFRCMQSSNVKLFEHLTAEGGCKKATNERQRKNILHEACIQKNLTLVKKIITCNNPEDRSSLLDMRMKETAETPLCLAVQHCDVETVKYLIDSGSCVDKRDGSGHNILHLALIGGSDDVVQYIENKYEDKIRELADDKSTSAMYAAFRGNLQRLQSYITLGVDQSAVTTTGLNILIASAYGGKTDVVNYILTKYDEMIDKTNVSKITAVHAAAASGDIDCLKTLINHEGIYPLSRTSLQQTLLHVAAFKKHPKTVEYICKEFPEIIQATDKGQYNAAHYAARGGDIDCLKTVINHGIDPLSKTSSQLTLLHVAAFCKHPKTVEYICKTYPFIIQLKNENQYNAAHAAAAVGDIDCLKTLVHHGIDPLSRASTQVTLLHVAALNKHPETVEYICKTYPPIIQMTDENQYNAAHYAAQSGNLDCLKTTITHGIDPWSRTSTQETLLHIAAYNKHPETVEYLCKTYPHMIPLTNKDQYNAAHCAAESGNIDCLKSLINHGIDPLSRTSTQKTVLHLAAYNKHPETVEYFCNTYPHMIQLTDNDQYNAAHYAAESGDLDCLKTLITHGIDPLSRHPSHDTLIHVAEVNHHLHVVEYLRKS